MIDDIRKRIFIRVSVVVAILIAALLLLLVWRRQPRVLPPLPTPPANLAGNKTETRTAPVAAPVVIKPAVSEIVKSDSNPEETYLLQLARIFVERFGSYSNQNDNRHILDALSLGSARMQTYLNSKRLAFSPNYQGMTTKVVASTIESRKPETASVHVDVQQVSAQLGASQVQYQSGTVALVREAGVWKVDGLYWK